MLWEYWDRIINILESKRETSAVELAVSSKVGGGERIPRLGDGFIWDGRFRLIRLMMAAEAFMLESHCCLADTVFVRSKGKARSKGNWWKDVFEVDCFS